MVSSRLDTHAFEAIPSRLAGLVRARAEATAGDLWGASPDNDEVVGAVRRFCDLVEDSSTAGRRRVADAYAETGRRWAREGRGPEELHHLLIRAARAVGHILNGPADAEIDQRIRAAITEAQFGFIDGVSTAFAEGHRAQAPTDGAERERCRRRLLELLLADQPADPEALAGLAERAGWTPPRTVAAVALAPRGEHEVGQVILSDELLVDHPGGAAPRLLLPDPDAPNRDRLLRPLLRDWVVAIGPPMPIAQAARSLAWARDTLTLINRGVIDGTGIVHSIDHVPSLIIFRSQTIIDSVASIRLAALSTVGDAQRRRLAETLLALLENNFNATEAGASLHVHPQTVRYRLRQLEELFGAELHDPRTRLEMQMILHAQLGRVRAPAGYRAEPGDTAPRRRAVAAS
ncbi:PucR family transcriptional regulator [Actinomadura craniellae]|uniref:PucR family transcriptional regulator n=1 Tax=Actinomadura craniellae TaxID=2231787 RepID=A0A365GZK8_9ACTN|nr:helix-turn-helix domain-containing protein [Actinomadura craniellae]RAY12247.1 PucR family transcriptional regulator [Actinomadura craniellae]